MGEKNKGNSRKISEVLFMRITRKKAKERINNEFKRYIKKEEKTIGEKLSKEEIKILRKDFIATRGKEIKHEEARKARVKATALAFAATLGIGGVGGYALGAHNNRVLGITDGKTKIEVDMNAVGKDVEIENVLQDGKEDKHSLFVKELQDAALNENVEKAHKLEQEPTQEEKISKEIKELDSEEKIDAYVANMYIDAKPQTEDEKLNTSDIRISQNSESYVYVLEDGQIVTHGDLPDETEKQIEADGKSHDEIIRDVKIYNVKLTETGETIDEMTTTLKRVIPGENYTDMKDYDSVLVDMGEIIQKAFKLKELLKELERSPGNEYIEGLYKNVQEQLVEEVIEYNKGKNVQINQESQMQENVEH